MAYTINLTDGTIFATVADGTIDTSSSVTLVGRNYVNYGEFVAENFVQMLENYAEITAPDNPLAGQLWYDTTVSASVLNVYDGIEWKGLGTVIRGASEPLTPVIGDQWYDVTNSQIKVYDGTDFILVGGGPGAGLDATGTEVAIITDNLDVDHVVVKLNVDGTIVGTISKDTAFTPDAGLHPELTGFASIDPGLQLTTDLTSAKFTGTATNAESLDGNGPGNFVSAITSDTMNGSLGVLDDGGITVGAATDGELSVSLSNVYLKNNTSNGDLLLQVNNGGLTTVIECDGVTGKAKVSAPTDGTDEIASANYVDATSVARDGSNTITGVITPDGDGTRDLGSAALSFATVHGSATALQSATTSVDVSAATAPAIGEVLTATGPTAAVWQAIIDVVHPVGSIYTSTAATNPGTLFGGTWASITGRVLFAEDGTTGYVAGNTGGAKDAVVVSHSHTGSFAGNALPTHSHTIGNQYASNAEGTSMKRSGSVDDGTKTTSSVSAGTPSGTITVDAAGVTGTNQNMPPYLAVYMWQRTA